VPDRLPRWGNARGCSGIRLGWSVGELSSGRPWLTGVNLNSSNARYRAPFKASCASNPTSMQEFRMESCAGGEADVRRPGSRPDGSSKPAECGTWLEAIADHAGQSSGSTMVVGAVMGSTYASR
jgi:hypothetical protein